VTRALHGPNPGSGQAKPHSHQRPPRAGAPSPSSPRHCPLGARHLRAPSTIPTSSNWASTDRGSTPWLSESYAGDATRTRPGCTRPGAPGSAGVRMIGGKPVVAPAGPAAVAVRHGHLRELRIGMRGSSLRMAAPTCRPNTESPTSGLVRTAVSENRRMTTIALVCGRVPQCPRRNKTSQPSGIACNALTRIYAEPERRIELLTYALRVRCSAV
jgi:hypothetical protein